MGLDRGKRGSRECPELEFEEVTVSQSASGRGCLSCQERRAKVAKQQEDPGP